jgi:hypothetical protein
MAKKENSVETAPVNAVKSPRAKKVASEKKAEIEEKIDVIVSKEEDKGIEINTSESDTIESKDLKSKDKKDKKEKKDKKSKKDKKKAKKKKKAKTKNKKKKK